MCKYCNRLLRARAERQCTSRETEKVFFQILISYIPRIRIGLFSDFLFSQHIVLTTNCDIPCLSSDCRFRKSYGVIVPKSTYGSAKT